MIIGFLYVLTNPAAFIAINLFRAAVIARIVHTFAYAIYSTQPARGISWAVCYFTTIYMGIQTAFFFL
jgi:glutathione S-transferase